MFDDELVIDDEKTRKERLGSLTRSVELTGHVKDKPIINGIDIKEKSSLNGLDNPAYHGPVISYHTQL